MRLTEIGTTRPATCRLETSVRQVAQVMAEQEMGAVIIVSEDGHVMGIVTARDLVVRGVATGKDGRTPVATVMSSDVVSIADTASTADAARNDGVACVPMVAGRGRPWAATRAALHHRAR